MNRLSISLSFSKRDTGPDRWLVILDFRLNFFSWKRSGKARVILGFGFGKPLMSKEIENEPRTQVLRFSKF
jgi:hypothetical protein